MTDDAPLMVFSADTHVGPGPDQIRPYVEERHREAFEEFAGTVDLYNAAFEQRAFSDEYWHGRALNAHTAGHHDPHAWLADMDHEGVSGGVIFADSLNGQPFPLDYMNMLGNGVPAPEARELAGVGRALYNRWLADFCAVDPDRCAGLAQLPMWDVDAAIAELEWCAEHGLCGVNFPAPGQAGLPSYSSPEMDHFFAACADLEMTLATHIGAVAPGTDLANPTSEGNFHFGLLDSGEWGIRTVYQLVTFGIFERHPKLKLVLTEVPGVYWDEMCLKLDSLQLSPIRRKDHALPRLPSEYLATNVWIGNSFQSRHEAVAAIEIGREDRFMWGSDYPHAEGTYSWSDDPERLAMTKLSLASTYHDLPVDKVRRLVGENMLDAFPRLDADALAKVAARVGPTPAELQDVPDLDAHPWIRATGTLAFRTDGPWN
jgi:predicted TIM-barrel fold metal-dependent hydrolase